MRKVIIEPLDREAFFDYGSWYDMLRPGGASVEKFYHDKVIFPCSSGWPLTGSCLVVEKPGKRVVSQAEYHDTTGECILPLDDDVVLPVAQASSGPVPQATRAFLVPRGTMVQLNCGVWHQAPIPLNLDRAHVLILLPQRVYQRDCLVAEYPPEEWMELLLPGEHGTEAP